MRFATGPSAQLEVLFALMIRETKTRFGSHELGYVWALIEPLLWILTFWGMFYALDRTAPGGMDTIAFIATGLIPYTLFRECVARAVTAVGANKGLLFYPQIQPLDLVLARVLLEAVTLALVFATIVLGAALWQSDVPRVDDWLVFLLAFASAGALGGALGLVLAAASVFTGVVERLHGPILRPLFWFSGVFFSANGLPPLVRDLFLYNPLLHIVEFVRSGWFSEYETEYGSVSYVLCWVIGLCFVGLVLERVARRRLEVV